MLNAAEEKQYQVEYNYYLQNFHAESIHPPNVCVEDEIIDILPVLAMLFD